jgi:hypothetical protein
VITVGAYIGGIITGLLLAWLLEVSDDDGSGDADGDGMWP